MSGEGKSRPKVLVLEGSERIGGGQRVTLDLISQLRDRFDFVVAVPAAGPLMDELGAMSVPVRAVPYPAPKGKFSVADRLSYLPRGVFATRHITRLVKEVDPDLIYATSRTALWAAMAGRITGKPVTLHLHMVPPTARTGWFLRRVAGMRQVKRTLVASPAISARIGGLSPKIIAAPNGVDIQRFRPRPELKEDLKAELGLSPETHLAVVIGEIAPDKGQDDAVLALRELRVERRDAALLIVGGARDVSQGFQSRLKSLTRQLGLEDRVIFTGHRSDVRRFLNGADIALIPSKGRSGEACPMAALEAWACGVPVAASETGGIPALLGTDRGVMFKPGDPESLAGVWRLLMNDHHLAERLSWSGLAAARGEFSLQEAVERARTAFSDAMAA